MNRSDTIDWGIDLGTTNSSLAILQGDKLRVVTNSIGEDTTPSAVARRNVGGRNVADVGKRAKQQLLGESPSNVAIEFKQMMGQPDWRHTFLTGDPAPAWQLSSAVLGELVKSQGVHGDLPPLTAAIIGVPAAFTNPQYDDTKKAAAHAGIGYAELLPEPVAAALAFAHHGTRTGQRLWLAYDLGGGTFDAALVRGEDGVFTVIDHEGDRQLGGKHLDNAIIMELVCPKLPETIQAKIEPWKSLYWWHLKLVAEEAKKLLSVEPDALVEATLDGFEAKVWLTQAEVNELQARLFGRCLAMCRTLLKRNNYEPSAIERVLMVGGPTKSPFLRNMVEHGEPARDGRDAVQGLGIRLDCTVDPLTAVAQGAALHAASRRIPRGKVVVSVPAGQMIVELNYPPQVVDDDPLVTGSLRPSDASTGPADGCAVVISRVDSSGKASWQSTPLPVSTAGKFSTRLPVLNGANEFRLQVSNAAGQVVPTNLTRFRIIKGIKTGQMTLPRHIGVADQSGKARWILKKGDPLPYRWSDIFKTTVAMKKGQSGKPIEIPVIEGDNDKAHLNELIYTLTVTAEGVEANIPLDSEVEVELSIDVSREITTKATFVDSGIVVSSKNSSRSLDAEGVRKSFQTSKADFDLLKQVSALSPKIAATVRRIEQEGMIDKIDSFLKVGNVETVDQAKVLLLDLLRRMDPLQEEANKLLVWDAHKRYCDRNMNMAKEIVAETSGITAQWKAEFAALQAKYQAAIDARNADDAEHISYTELPTLFRTSEVLKTRVGGGSAAAGGAATISGVRTTGDLK